MEKILIAYFIGLALGLATGWWTTPKATKLRLVYLALTVLAGVFWTLKY